jgi:HPt (histidine-containing phosphotransfer) domain-containing protein
MADIIGGMYSHLDPSRAHDFAMDNDQMLNLAQTFESSLTQDLSALTAALDNQDPDPMRRLLHSLKGYVTFLSKEELSGHVIQLEAMSRQSSLDEVKDRVVQFIPALKTLLSEVSHWKSTTLVK